ncbi:MAG TPA: hypothetical protein VFW35_07570 [Sphingomicrobium sp.]|nr:hypothetical protein [Sphingomicrobium sp.]
MSFLLFAALLSANPTVQAAPPAPTAPALAAKPQKEKLICKVEDGDTGSHMVKRTCLTQQQWDDRIQGRSVDEFNSTAQPAH